MTEKPSQNNTRHLEFAERDFLVRTIHSMVTTMMNRLQKEDPSLRERSEMLRQKMAEEVMMYIHRRPPEDRLVYALRLENALSDAWKEVEQVESSDRRIDLQNSANSTSLRRAYDRMLAVIVAVTSSGVLEGEPSEKVALALPDKEVISQNVPVMASRMVEYYASSNRSLREGVEQLQQNMCKQLAALLRLRPREERRTYMILFETALRKAWEAEVKKVSRAWEFDPSDERIQTAYDRLLIIMAAEASLTESEADRQVESQPAIQSTVEDRRVSVSQVLRSPDIGQKVVGYKPLQSDED